MFSEINNRNNKEIQYVCIADTTYVLLLYCLSKPLSEIMSTLFVVGKKFPKSILSKLPNNMVMEVDLGNNYIDLCRNILKERNLLSKKYPFIMKCPLYGIDHITKSYVLLNHRKMVVVEDGRGLYKPPACKQTPISLFIKKILGIPLNTFGRGEHCSEIIYSGLMPYTNKGKKLTKINIKKELLNNKERTQFIYSLYNISEEDIILFQKKDVVIITQPIEEIGDYTESDKFNLYGKCLDECNIDKVIIKTHPRDVSDYNRRFPSVSVFTKPVPLEIMALLGGGFKKAYTYSSTAIYSMPETTEKIFIKDWFNFI